ncbi:7-carboxy-7-deazaguanine synthase QueE [Metabacillus idriensis]|uniref:7-carboxy-7-deazaguanine synthase QueE n=1 Tax=Metabacillus idriensis TaxID=324768 RepID=UPI00174EC4AD|nr:7-carboxy-7-deazaguanine synthase QueE [Metabacillus idriensis]
MMKKIPTLEIFGPTIQGEGSVAGKKTMFLRTAGCDYSCVWCDSSFTWDGSSKEDIKLMSSQDIYTRLVELGGNNFSHVTISGGNPLLLEGLSELVDILKEKNIEIAVETQGTKWQDWLLNINDITISPKPPSSKMETNLDKLDFMIENLATSAVNSKTSLKVVIFDDEDFEYAKVIHKRYPLIPFYLQVGNIDINEKNNDKLIKDLLLKYEWLINKVLSAREMNRVFVLPQLHTLLWGNKRGV